MDHQMFHYGEELETDISTISWLREQPRWFDFSGDCSCQAGLQLTDDWMLRVGSTDTDVAECPGLWCDIYPMDWLSRTPPPPDGQAALKFLLSQPGWFGLEGPHEAWFNLPDGRTLRVDTLTDELRAHIVKKA